MLAFLNFIMETGTFQFYIVCGGLLCVIVLAVPLIISLRRTRHLRHIHIIHSFWKEKK